MKPLGHVSYKLMSIVFYYLWDQSS